MISIKQNGDAKGGCGPAFKAKLVKAALVQRLALTWLNPAAAASP